MLDTVQQIKYDNTLFITPKKEGNVRFITDYLILNQQLVRKPYPLPIICKTVHHLEGFRYGTVLDIKMKYYSIRISNTSQDMTTTVTEFFKFRYNRLPIGMFDLGDIFQSKVDKLFGDIEGFKSYIDYIIVLSKDCFTKRIEQLRIIFGIVRAAGLKVDAPNFSSWLK